MKRSRACFYRFSTLRGRLSANEGRIKNSSRNSKKKKESLTLEAS